MRLLVIADDFTGSLDTGVQMAKAGIDTSVFFERDGRLPDIFSCPDPVVVVDTESRHLLPREAHRRVMQVVHSGMQAGFDHFYKKIDSALRGNIGAELDALLTSCGEERMIFAPAFPALGRTTRNGIQFVNGVPLAQTEFASDPFNPVRFSRIDEILAEQTVLTVTDLSAALLSRPFARQILVADAVTDTDLKEIGAIARRSGMLKCLAGCAGFASVLPELLDLPRQTPLLTTSPPGRLLVCGSIHPRSLDQCDRAVVQEGYLPLLLTPEQILKPDAVPESIFHLVDDRLGCGGKVLLRIRGERDAVEETYRLGRSMEIPEEQISKRVAAGFGSLTARFFRQSVHAALIVFGGDTLWGISQAMPVRAIRPLRELLPGIVLSTVTLPDRQISLVTKAGSFGSPEVVREIDQSLSDKDGQITRGDL